MRKTISWLNAEDSFHAVTVLISLGIIIFFLSLGAAIGGSYVITINAINNAQVARDKVQIQAAIPQCRSIVELDQASKGVKFYTPPGFNQRDTYGYRLRKAFHDVDKATRCQQLLTEVAHHVPYSQIIKDLEKHK